MICLDRAYVQYIIFLVSISFHIVGVFISFFYGIFKVGVVILCYDEDIH